MTNSRATPNDRLNAVLLYNSYNPKEYLCSFNVLHQIYVCCSMSINHRSTHYSLQWYCSASTQC